MCIDKSSLEALWETHRVADIAKKLKTSQQSVYYWARKYRLHSPSRQRDSKNDPDEDVIAERAAEVRASWSPEELEQRLVGNIRKPTPWRPPVYAIGVSSGILVMRGGRNE